MIAPMPWRYVVDSRFAMMRDVDGAIRVIRRDAIGDTARQHDGGAHTRVDMPPMITLDAILHEVVTPRVPLRH